MHLSMSSGGGERRGIGWGFDIFQKIAAKFPTPGKNVRSNVTEIPNPRETKIQISLSPGQQDNSTSPPSLLPA